MFASLTSFHVFTITLKITMMAAMLRSTIY